VAPLRLTRIDAIPAMPAAKLREPIATRSSISPPCLTFDMSGRSPAQSASHRLDERARRQQHASETSTINHPDATGRNLMAPLHETSGLYSTVRSVPTTNTDASHARPSLGRIASEASVSDPRDPSMFPTTVRTNFGDAPISRVFAPAPFPQKYEYAMSFSSSAWCPCDRSAKAASILRHSPVPHTAFPTGDSSAGSSAHAAADPNSIAEKTVARTSPFRIRCASTWVEPRRSGVGRTNC
jgi:hypothetical protein